MSYTALYRKFRPQNFEDVKGQDPIVTTLKNQIKNERTSHAYLFCGTRGTGKTTMAKIFARAVNCENPQDGSPCGECAMCRAILNGSSMNVIEMDAASNNGVENVRQIIDEVTYSPTEGKYKVYIIDEVHMLSPGAFNALLKTLEEPPSYVIFILATTDVYRIPITILSRCQRYDFRRISIDTISDRIKELTAIENVQIDDKAVRFVAKTADGSMRDALSLLDQCIAFYFSQELTYDKVLNVLGAVDTGVFSKIIRAVIKGDVTGTLKVLEEIVIQGREMGQFISDLTWYLRNLLLIRTAETNEDIIDLSTDNMAKLKEEATLIDEDVIIRYIRVLSELSGALKYSTNKRVLAEIALIKLCRPQMETDDSSVLDRIRVLEDKIANGVQVVSNVSPDNVASAERIENKKVVLDKALPDDIKEAVSKWGIIVSDTDPVFHQYLQDAYPSIEGEDTLVIVFKTRYGFQRFESQERQEELRNAISLVIDKDIKMTVRLDSHEFGSAEIYPDIRSMVEESIDFEIDEIDDEDFDDYDDIERNDEDG